MFKFVYFTYVALAMLQFSPITTNAFFVKTKTVQKEYPVSLSSTVTASKDLLTESLSNVVISKNDTIKLDTKIVVKASLLPAVLFSSGGNVKSFNGVSASEPALSKGYSSQPLFTKIIVKESSLSKTYTSGLVRKSVPTQSYYQPGNAQTNSRQTGYAQTYSSQPKNTETYSSLPRITASYNSRSVSQPMYTKAYASASAYTKTYLSGFVSKPGLTKTSTAFYKPVHITTKTQSGAIATANAQVNGGNVRYMHRNH